MRDEKFRLIFTVRCPSEKNLRWVSIKKNHFQSLFDTSLHFRDGLIGLQSLISISIFVIANFYRFDSTSFQSSLSDLILLTFLLKDLPRNTVISVTLEKHLRWSKTISRIRNGAITARAQLDTTKECVDSPSYYGPLRNDPLLLVRTRKTSSLLPSRNSSPFLSRVSCEARVVRGSIGGKIARILNNVDLWISSTLASIA